MKYDWLIDCWCLIPPSQFCRKFYSWRTPKCTKRTTTFSKIKIGLECPCHMLDSKTTFVDRLVIPVPVDKLLIAIDHEAHPPLVNKRSSRAITAIWSQLTILSLFYILLDLILLNIFSFKSSFWLLEFHQNMQKSVKITF